MSGGEGSYQWWHYCNSAEAHYGVRCINHCVSERQKYLDKDKDLDKYLDKDKDLDKYLDKYLDKESKTMESMMDKFEENRMNWAKFNKTHCEGKKCG